MKKLNQLCIIALLMVLSIMKTYEAVGQTLQYPTTPPISNYVPYNTGGVTTPGYIDMMDSKIYIDGTGKTVINPSSATGLVYDFSVEGGMSLGSNGFITSGTNVTGILGLEYALGIGTNSPNLPLTIHNATFYSLMQFTNGTTGTGLYDGLVIGLYDPTNSNVMFCV